MANLLPRVLPIIGALVALLVAVSTGGAAPRRVVVIEGDESKASVTAAAVHAIQALERRLHERAGHGFRFLGRESAREWTGSGPRARPCDVPCMLDVARQLGADYVVLAKAESAGGRLGVRVVLVREQGGKKLFEDHRKKLDPKRLDPALAHLVDQVVEALHRDAPPEPVFPADVSDDEVAEGQQGPYLEGSGEPDDEPDDEPREEPREGPESIRSEGRGDGYAIALNLGQALVMGAAGAVAGRPYVPLDLRVIGLQPATTAAFELRGLYAYSHPAETVQEVALCVGARIGQRGLGPQGWYLSLTGGPGLALRGGEATVLAVANAEVGYGLVLGGSVFLDLGLGLGARVPVANLPDTWDTFGLGASALVPLLSAAIGWIDRGDP